MEISESARIEMLKIAAHLCGQPSGHAEFGKTFDKAVAALRQGFHSLDLDRNDANAVAPVVVAGPGKQHR